MGRTQTIVQLTEELVQQLDAEASRRGRSRSALIRDAVAAYLLAQRRDEVGARIVEGYRRAPTVEPDEWGDLLGAGHRSTLEALQRLDAEERGQGFEPW